MLSSEQVSSIKSVRNIEFAVDHSTEALLINGTIVFALSHDIKSNTHKNKVQN